jgi:hypothetical protein
MIDIIEGEAKCLNEDKLCVCNRKKGSPSVGSETVGCFVEEAPNATMLTWSAL